MQKTTKRYCDIDCNDVIRAGEWDKYQLFIKFLKDNLHYGIAQPQGGGDYHFELDFLDFEPEEMKEDYFEDEYCPIPVAEVILALKTEQKIQGLDGLKMRYIMDGWT